ncbi:uncharacterized protein LOC112691010 [Sipha flava]|uniref:Regulatory protein zeste n=1 Tax=Sipha flava TaxID=143950 RepID=A0A8B8GE13_9HEMI|nr:uncharacterized protein LOC112691010 [Sipha flava]
MRLSGVAYSFIKMSKSRPTQSQMKSLVDLVAKDPLLCASKFTPTLTQKIAIEIWQNIAEQLNTLPGAEKSGCKWKKTWQDTKSATKTKAAAIKRHIGGTGGGLTCDIQLNNIQKDALSLINPSSVNGHENTVESHVEFIFEIPKNVTLDLAKSFKSETLSILISFSILIIPKFLNLFWSIVVRIHVFSLLIAENDFSQVAELIGKVIATLNNLTSKSTLTFKTFLITIISDLKESLETPNKS